MRFRISPAQRACASQPGVGAALRSLPWDSCATFPNAEGVASMHGEGVGLDTTPLGLDHRVRFPGVASVALRQPRAEMHNPVWGWPGDPALSILRGTGEKISLLKNHVPQAARNTRILRPDHPMFHRAVSVNSVQSVVKLLKVNEITVWLRFFWSGLIRVLPSLVALVARKGKCSLFPPEPAYTPWISTGSTLRV